MYVINEKHAFNLHVIHITVGDCFIIKETSFCQNQGQLSPFFLPCCYGNNDVGLLDHATLWCGLKYPNSWFPLILIT